MGCIRGTKVTSPHKVGVLTVLRKSDYVLVKTEYPMEEAVVIVVVVAVVVVVLVLVVAIVIRFVLVRVVAAEDTLTPF